MMMEIFDPLRRKKVKLTPEEGVRQGIIRWLAESAGVPVTLMSSEYSFKYNGLSFRADIVVFDRSLEPLLVVECKAPSVKLGVETVEQAARYNRALKVRYIMVTNGGTAFFFRRDEGSGSFIQVPQIPIYSEMVKQ